MNSDEEKALFHLYGWTYDYVKRRWFAPVAGIHVTLDEVVSAAQTPDGEEQLAVVIRRYGVRQEAK